MKKDELANFLIVNVISNIYIAVPVFLLTLLLYYLGFFRYLTVEEALFPSYRICYKFSLGPYKTVVGPLFAELCGIIDDVATPEMTLSEYKLVGIYYDDPNKTNPKRCRSAVGVVLPDREKGVVLEASLNKSGWRSFSLPEADSLNVDFPLRRSFMQLSIAVAVLKVYSKLTKEAEKRNVKGPIIEIYDNDFVRYYIPFEKASAFYVEEATIRKLD